MSARERAFDLKFLIEFESFPLAFLLEETARKILPEAVLHVTCCVSGNIHMGCGYYKWGSRDIIRCECAREAATILPPPVARDVHFAVE